MNAPESWSERVERYLSYRRSAGFILESDSGKLRQFARFAEQQGHQAHLTVALAAEWARSSKRQSPITWARRIELLRGFAKYCQRFDAATEIPPRGLLGHAHRRLVPHLFTEEEVLTLMDATRQLLPRNGLRPATCRIVFGLLAATGLRLAEAIRLTRADVDLDTGVLSIREAKGHNSRLVPLHPSATAELRAYAQLRDRLLPRQSHERFFLLDHGQPANTQGMRRALRTLCRRLGWHPRGDHAHHRLCDLRHGFIVNSLLRFYQQGIVTNQVMPALSAYVGHAQVADTYWYCTGVPELMAITGERFRRYAHGEST